MAQTISDPRELFAHKLGAALTMERTVLEILEENEQKATEDELKQQLAHHRDETEQQIQNLEQAFTALGRSPQRKPCPAIEGLREEGATMTSQVSQDLIDSVILGGAAEIEHHEIAVYDGLITNAEQMDQDDIVSLLEENLDQEEHTLKEVEKAAEKEAKKLAERVSA
jgi:ferritin-like metal-binding protein YciE